MFGSPIKGNKYHKYIIDTPQTLAEYKAFGNAVMELEFESEGFPREANGRVVYPPGYIDCLEEMQDTLSSFKQRILPDLMKGVKPVY